jgi:hypothetical protein
VYGIKDTVVKNITWVCVNAHQVRLTTPHKYPKQSQFTQ